MSFYNTKNGFNIGRFAEGLASGLALPVLFSNVIKLETLGSEGKRLALFNSITALGFVLGPISLSILMKLYNYKDVMYIFGLGFIFIPIMMFFFRLHGNHEKEGTDISLKSIFIKNPWFEKFSTLFLAKSFYGFFLTLVPSYLMNYFDKSMTVTKVMFIFSILFIIGQVITEKIISVFPKEHLETYIPIILAFALIAFYITGNPLFICACALFQSMLVFIGYINFSMKTDNAREFAIFNSISDPAIVIGAFLANLGVNGIWGILPLMFIPLIRAFILPANYTRAEYVYPYFGPVTFYKTVKKHSNPLKKPREKEMADTTLNVFENGTRNDKTIRLLFAGDFCPSPNIYKLSEKVKEFIISHDLRFINFEGYLSPLNNCEIKSWSLHNIPNDDFQRLIVNNENNPVFNVLSLVNNHIFDGGKAGLKYTLDTLTKYKNINPVTSELTVIENNDLKIGIFSLTFGVNMPWLKDEKIKWIKPERIVKDKKIQKRVKDLIKKYKLQVDILILSYHWGYESEYFPSTIQKECFKILSDFGVDILYGHHAHIFQPYEIMNNKLSLYSCGNLTNSADMPQKIYNQGILYSVEIEFVKKMNIINISPYFIEPNEKNEIIFINKDNSEAYQNWLEYRT